MYVSKEKVILTDCDGVLFDWVHGFMNYMEGRGYSPVRGWGAMYKINEVFGVDKEVTKPLVSSFNESAWIRDLTPFRDAVKYVRKLHTDHGYVFHAITSQSDCPKARQLRIENLEAVFGKGIFEVVTCLPCGGDKDEALAKYKGTGCFWVEDKAENADVGAAAGLNSLLLAHGYNVAYNGDAVRVNNWHEIYNIITG